ncbi:hypothetical protein FB45DRAFT_1060561 [Roridomyces roridus]|uniref:Uncharacterized protein n=1 Tax=Roridomyces roridus TaxID=1738132 RepID=A0AAD7BNS0_9AGAR|nr:hypothetical protein FB45DRAFT_1060561 [Roridomyces roridus]
MFFPGELVDSVIDLVRSDPITLADCALVCRQWVPRSRYHYFSSVQLVRNTNRDTLRTFILILASPLATFISSVREVYIFHHSSYGTPVLSAGDIIGLFARYGLAPTLLHLSCSLRHLGAAAPLPSVTHLRLELGPRIPDSRPAAFELVVNFIHEFPGLRSLALGVGLQILENVAGYTLRPPPPNLREIEISTPAVLGYMLSLGTPLILPELIVRFVDEQQWGEVERYLSDERVRGRIECLTLTDCSALPVLPSLEGLGHLVIAQPFHYMGPHLRVALLSLSRTASAKRLESLTLHGTRHGRGEAFASVLPPVGEWSEMDDILTDVELWPRLRTVYVCGGDGLEGRTPELMVTLLPLCLASGILKVGSVDPAHRHGLTA